MDLLDSIKSFYGAQPLIMANNTKGPHCIGIDGEKVVKQGKNAKYEVSTCARNARFKWEVKSPDKKVRIFRTKTIIYKPTTPGDHTLRVIVTDKQGRTGETSITIKVLSAKKITGSEF